MYSKEVQEKESLCFLQLGEQACVCEVCVQTPCPGTTKQAKNVSSEGGAGFYHPPADSQPPHACWSAEKNMWEVLRRSCFSQGMVFKSWIKLDSTCIWQNYVIRLQHYGKWQCYAIYVAVYLLNYNLNTFLRRYCELCHLFWLLKDVCFFLTTVYLFSVYSFLSGSHHVPGRTDRVWQTHRILLECLGAFFAAWAVPVCQICL